MPKPIQDYILIADDDPNILQLASAYLQRWNYKVRSAVNKSELLGHLARHEPLLLLLDLHFGADDGLEVLSALQTTYPNLQVIMLTGNNSVEIAVRAIKLGAYDYLTKPPDFERLRLVVNHAIKTRRLHHQVDRLSRLVDEKTSHLLVGDSAPMRKVRELISSVAPCDANVLFLGDSGTGKDLAARTIHAESKRVGGPFVPVNMAAIPRELVESTLFGHEKGAFTGADRPNTGCCEAAHHGTLFLDEIAEMELGLQAKLLRFLQERTFQRVGSSRLHHVDVRIVAATNRDPESQVRKGLLREDLYYRLNVVPIILPPLRERVEDIPQLAMRFLHRAAVRNHKLIDGFRDAVLEIFMHYDWPGNVRQLENVVERMVIFATGPWITPDEVPDEVRGAAALGPAMRNWNNPQHSKLNKVELMEKQAIVAALKKCQGNVTRAVALLGLSQATIYRKLKRFGLQAKEFCKNPEEVEEAAAM